MGCSCNSGAGSTVIQGAGVIAVSGSGTASDPYILSEGGGGQTLQFEVRDSGTVNMTLFGSGTKSDPYILRADTSSASNLRALADVSATPTVQQGAVPLWIGTPTGGHFEFRLPGVRYTTNATRGSGTYQGEVIRETDTGKRYEWDGTQWVDLSPAYVPPSALDPSVLANAGTLDPGTDWNTLTAKSGIYRVATYASSANGPSGAYNYGTLLVFISGTSVSQQYLEHGANSGGTLWTRTKFNASDWGPWRATASNVDVANETSARTSDVNQVRNSANFDVARITHNGYGGGVNSFYQGYLPDTYYTKTAAEARFYAQPTVDSAFQQRDTRLTALENAATPTFLVATGWSVNRINFWRSGRTLSMDLSLKRTGSTIASGNIANLLMGQITGGFGTAGYMPLSSGPGGTVASFYIQLTSIYLAATTASIASGAEVTCGGTWVMS